jgi:DNA-binding transcriptional ArsR family regulator
MPGIPKHIRLLNLLGAIRDLSPFDVMTADEEELLRDLVVRWNSSGEITVSEIMKSLADVSETTAYRRLISLRDKGLVSLRVDKSDKRVKFVEPTSLADDYAQRIRQVMDQLAGEGRTT